MFDPLFIHLTISRSEHQAHETREINYCLIKSRFVNNLHLFENNHGHINFAPQNNKHTILHVEICKIQD